MAIEGLSVPIELKGFVKLLRKVKDVFIGSANLLPYFYKKTCNFSKIARFGNNYSDAP